MARDGPRISSWGGEGAEISAVFFFFFFFFFKYIYIILINYQLRKILKNHFLIYQDQLFEIVFEIYGYFPELRYRYFLELGNEYFLGLEHRHFPELGNIYFLELERPYFPELE